jgi:hypothetical protein
MENRGFKRSTIENIITNKINSGLKHVDNEEIKKVILENYILTGGAITSLLQGENPNDYDLYFKDYKSARAVANYYITKLNSTNPFVKIFIDDSVTDRIKIVIKSSGVVQGQQDTQEGYDYFEGIEGPQATTVIESYLNKEGVKSKEKYAIAMVTSNAISLNNDIQLIFRFFGDPEEIHENYDFIHVTNYFTKEEGLVLKVEALEAILSKTLHYVGSRYPICSMFRIRKYINRGWTISAGEMLKIAFDINKLELEDMDVLYEQLVGVDAAYFHQLISMLKEFQAKNPDVDIDRSYLFQLINKVFDKTNDHHMEDNIDNIDLGE